MDQQDQVIDERATQIHGKTQDYEQVENWIDQLLNNNDWNLDDVLNAVEKNKFLKDYSRFSYELFESKPEIVIEMIQWIFTPKRIIARKQLQPYPKAKYQKPFLCKRIIQNNKDFYENMYKAAEKQSIPITLWFHFLTVEPIDECIMPTILSYFKDIFINFIKHDYHYSNLNFSYDLQKSHSQISHSILKLFPDTLIKSLLDFCYYEEIFLFLYKLLLVGLQEQLEEQRAINLLRKLYERAKQDDMILKNLNNLMKEIIKNIIQDRLRRGNILIHLLIQTNMCQHCVNRTINSDLCQNPQATKKKQEIQQQQQLIEYHLSFLIEFINIYCKIVQQSPIKSNLSEQQQIQDSSLLKEIEKIQVQNSIIPLMQKQILYILSNIHSMCKLIEHQQFRTITLPNEQQIKPVTLVKYQFLKLLLECLRITKINPNLVLNMNEIDIFPLIIRYLTENRWNNQVHHLLQKIAKELIINNYNFFRQKNIEKNKIADSFLGNLAKEFTNKHYWFLNTGNVTTQGNLHSIYCISIKIAYELNTNDLLLKVWKDFQPWKKHIVKDLKNYEDGLKLGIPIDKQLALKKQSASVKVDQAASISKLLTFIDFTQSKWPIKQTRKLKRGKNIYNISRTPERGSFYHNNDNMTQSQNYHKNRNHLQQKEDNPPQFPTFKKSSSEQQLIRIKKIHNNEQLLKKSKKQMTCLQKIKQHDQIHQKTQQQKSKENPQNTDLQSNNQNITQ